MDLTGIAAWDSWLTLKNGVRRRVGSEILGALYPNPGLVSRLDTTKQMNRAFSRGLRFGDGLDYFYAKHRVRNFIGLG
jgi:hypothetical protein